MPADERSSRFTESLFSRISPPLACFALATAHAWPELINAHELHSDAAIVGLQARHLFHGEWSWFLWGSGYQTSLDSVVAALYFLLLGKGPLALTLSTFGGHLLLVLCAYLTLVRRYTRWQAALLVLPLCVVTGPLHIYMFSPPRQAALTLVFFAIWLIDGAPAARRPARALALGGAVAGLACLGDPYALVFLPGLAVFLALSAWQGDPPLRLARAASGFAGGLLGIFPAWLLRQSPQASHGVFGLTSGMLSHNLDLLWHVCLPYLLAVSVYFSNETGLHTWQPPTWFHWLQLVGAATLLGGIVWGGVSVALARLPFERRRLAALGATTLPVTLVAFALSVMVMDRLSARYLVAIVLTAPFALGPALDALGSKRFALALTPWLLSSMVAGWLAHGADLAGIWPVRHDPRTSDETALRAALRARDLERGLADYWVAYRLTFLYDEEVVIAPWHANLDRYPPYRQLVGAAHRVAYIYDPWRSKEDLATREASITHAETEFLPNLEKFTAGRYTVLVLTR
ncbi:MAG TPA: hypothetical protein VGI10_28495 [Polyangiaceae bacterium]|jgi:hypothetical protein